MSVYCQYIVSILSVYCQYTIPLSSMATGWTRLTLFLRPINTNHTHITNHTHKPHPSPLGLSVDFTTFASPSLLSHEELLPPSKLSFNNLTRVGVACTSLWGGRGLGASDCFLTLPCLVVNEVGVVSDVGVACEEGVAPLFPLCVLLLAVVRLSRSNSLCNRYL